MDAESIKKEAREEFHELPRKTIDGCWYVELGSANSSMQNFIDKATLAECNRILKALPPIRHKITGEYKDRRASGFNECRKLVIKIIKEQDDEL